MGRLLDLRSRHPAFLTGRVTDLSTNDLVFFSRAEGSDQGLVMANVRNRTVTASIPESLQGGWLDGQSGGATNLTSQVTLPPYGFIVLLRAIAASPGQHE